MSKLKQIREPQTSQTESLLANSGRLLKSSVGMTIVEIMIVLTIVASLMGAIAFAAFGAVDSANDKEAAIRVKRLTENVNMYYMTSSPKKLPGSLEDLAKPPNQIVDKVEPDPWGNDYVYTKKGGRKFEIRSNGRDGSPNTADDICAEGPCSEAN